MEKVECSNENFEFLDIREDIDEEYDQIEFEAMKQREEKAKR